MYTSLATGATLIAILMLSLVPASVISFFKAHDETIVRDALGILLSIAMASASCGAAVWLWQKAVS